MRWIKSIGSDWAYNTASGVIEDNQYFVKPDGILIKYPKQNLKLYKTGTNVTGLAKVLRVGTHNIHYFEENGDIIIDIVSAKEISDLAIKNAGSPTKKP